MSEISFEDFLKVELRTGKVISAEPVPKSKKLLKLVVNFGEMGERIILAGVAQHLSSEAIIGRNVVAVVNLAPREMMGIPSHGMLLAAQGADNSLHLVECNNNLPGVRVG